MVEKKKSGVRQLIGCYRCGFGKSRFTHSFATYRLYKAFGRVIARCKTCGAERVFRIIEGGG